MTNAVLYQVLDVLLVLAAVNFIINWVYLMWADDLRVDSPFIKFINVVLAIALGLILLITNLRIWLA